MNNFISYIEGKTCQTANITVLNTNLDVDSEIGMFLNNNKHVISHTINSNDNISIVTNINLEEDLYLLSDNVLEPIREMGYDIKLNTIS